MNAIELLQYQLEASKNMTAGLLADMLDAPMAVPTSSGGNHPTWIAGHLALAESNLTTFILTGEENPLAGWKELFGMGSIPSDEASKYPPLAELLATWDSVREKSLTILGSVSESDLDKPSANPPEGREGFFGTYGKVFSAVALHPLMHRGQVADARLAAGRRPLMA